MSGKYKKLEQAELPTLKSLSEPIVSILQSVYPRNLKIIGILIVFWVKVGESLSIYMNVSLKPASKLSLRRWHEKITIPKDKLSSLYEDLFPWIELLFDYGCAKRMFRIDPDWRFQIIRCIIDCQQKDYKVELQDATSMITIKEGKFQWRESGKARKRESEKKIKAKNNDLFFSFFVDFTLPFEFFCKIKTNMIIQN